MWGELNPMWHPETVHLRIPICNYRHLLNNHKCNNHNNKCSRLDLYLYQFKE